MGIDAGHLLTASVISAPAALLIAKVLQPETEQSKTAGSVQMESASQSVNVLEAAAEGTSAGLQLALNVGAMLIVFVAFVAMANAFFGWAGGYLAYYFGGVKFELPLVGEVDFSNAGKLSMELMLGYAMAPFAWLMGVPANECTTAGSILGTRTVVNEFLAYIQLGQKQSQLSLRTNMILTYALCGFANFSSIGIQLGGIGGIAPDRRSDLARLGLRAMIGGTLAAFMTACVAGFLLSNEDLERRATQKSAAAEQIQSEQSMVAIPEYSVLR